MPLIAYIRVSTDDQATTGHSLRVQREALAAWARLHGHTLGEVMADEGVSASRPLEQRPGGAQLLAALRAGQGSGVVVTRLDRLFRDSLDGLAFFREATGGGWAVHSVSELINSATPAGRLALSIQLATAAYERDMAVARSTEVNLALQRAARPYGPTPYGMRINAAGRLERCPVRWPVRELIVRLRGEGMAYAQIDLALRRHRIRTPGGKRGWAVSTLSGIVKSHARIKSIGASLDSDALVSPAGRAGQGDATAATNVGGRS